MVSAGWENGGILVFFTDLWALWKSGTISYSWLIGQHNTQHYSMMYYYYYSNLTGGNWCIGGDLVRLTQLVSSRAGIWIQAVSLTLESMLLTLNLFHLSNEIVNCKDGDHAYHLLAQCLHSPHPVNISPLVLPCTLAGQQTEYIELGLSS